MVEEEYDLRYGLKKSYQKIEQTSCYDEGMWRVAGRDDE